MLRKRGLVSKLLLIGGLLAPGIHGQQDRRSTSPGGPWLSGSIDPGVDRENVGPGTVVAQQKISSEQGGFPDTLDDFDRFGSSVAPLGDLDGDGVGDLAVGAFRDANGGTPRGAVWVLFLEADGTVKTQRKIDGNEGGFMGAFGPQFGISVAALGDLDGDGVVDLAVGADGDDDGGGDRGSVWVLFLATDGTVKARQKISDREGGFTGTLRNIDLFGASLAALGDLDGDGVRDLAVGARGDDDGGDQHGAVWVLFLEPDGTVKAHQKISATQGGFGGTLGDSDFFGCSVTALGDLDGDGVTDLAVGANSTDGAALGEGAVWVLFLRADGTVRTQQEISSTEGGFMGGLEFIDFFGSSVTALGDLDGDGVADMAVGTPGDDDGGTNRGATYVLFLDTDGTVKGQQKISSSAGGFTGALADGDSWSISVAAAGDLNGDGVTDLAAGALETDQRGAVWVLFLAADGTVQAQHRISDGAGGLPASTLEGNDSFGRSLVALGDLDGDGISELAVGASAASFSTSRGAVWVLFPRSDGTLRDYRKIDENEGGIPAGALSGFFNFGMSVAALGDLDGDGVNDLAVGALEIGGSGGAGSRLGAVWVLFLRADGTVREHRITSVPRALVNEGDDVARSLATLGDLDGDGVVDLLAGAPGDDDGGGGSSANRGALWVLFLQADGALKAYQKISATQGDFTGTLDQVDEFGDSAGALGDLDGDGVADVAVGAHFDDDGGGSAAANRGAVYVLFLRPDGTVKAHTKISATQGGFGGALHDSDFFGASVTGIGDLDGDGTADLAVGAPGIRDGSVWMLFLGPDGTVKTQLRIGAAEGGFSGELDDFDFFGTSLAHLGDRDGDGVADLGIGAPGDDDGGGQHGALWLLSLDGIATLDFEGGDDQARTRLVNGQDISSPPEFGHTIELASFGANLGPAIFDSTTGGPNDPSQDKDLLVDLGNLLIFQNSQVPAQTVPGIFDRPNDDQDGGTFTFTFHAPVEPLSLDLVDIDLGTAQSASVTLSNANGWQRFFSIPMGWTGDIALDGPPGFRTLDLTTLDPQPGFVSTATAVQGSGFDPRAVVQIDVHLGSSGAVDNLRWDPHPDL